MDVRFINPFIKSIRNVYQTMMRTDIVFGKPQVKTDGCKNPDVSAVIGYSGDASGAVVIAYQRQAAITTASKFASMELDVSHPDFADALGEIANMIAGGAKAEFEGLDVDPSLPSVIVGDNHEVSNSKVNPSLTIPCDCSFGAFNVHVTMKLEKQAAVGAAS